MGDGAVTIYEQLRRAGCEMDSHEPDLYVKLTPLSSAILNCNFQYPDVFVSDRAGTPRGGARSLAETSRSGNAALTRRLSVDQHEQVVSVNASSASPPDRARSGGPRESRSTGAVPGRCSLRRQIGRASCRERG